MGLGEEERALGAALDSGDADLVYLVLFRMQRTLPLQQFLAVLAARPAARSLFNAYCAQMVQGADFFYLFISSATVMRLRGHPCIQTATWLLTQIGILKSINSGKE